MGLIDTVESMNNDFNTKFNALQQELAVGSSIGTTSGNPFYVQDSSVNTSIKSVYDFMRTETMAHYKTYKSNSDLTNTLLAELIKVTEDVWDHSGYLDVDDAIRQSNSDLQMSISESFDEFIDKLKKQQDGAISELQAALDERNTGSLGSDEVPDLNPGKSSGWKSMMGSAVKAGVSFLGTQIVTAIADAATKFSQLNADRYDLMAELFENYEGMTEDKAMQIATDEMTGKGHRDYTQLTRQEQLGLKQFNEDFARSIGIMQRNWERQRQITRKDEKRQWGQEATLSAAQVFKIPSLIGAAKDTIYDMERRMPGLNLQATEFFKTMTAVFDKTGEMGRETFEEISKLSRNLMVDPNTLLQISDTYSRYIKLMTKGGRDFQKQMTNVLKITAKLEDQFVNADGVMGEVMDLALTPIYEMSEDQLTRAQLQARELGMSIQEWQTYAQTDMAGAAEAIVNADRSYIERVGIDLSDGISQQEFALMEQFNIKGDQITELLARGNVDLTKADEKINADTGTDLGLMQRKFELSNELYEFGKQLDQMYWDHGIALEDRHWNKLQDAERRAFDFDTKWNHTFLTKWDEMQRKLDNWLLRNPILKAIDDFLMTITMGKFGLGHVVTGTALTAGGTMLWKAGKAMFGSGGAGGAGAAGAGGAGSAAATSGGAAGTLGTAAVPVLASGTAIAGGLYSGYQGTKNYAAGQELYSGETGNANSKSAGAWKMAGGTAQMAGGALAAATGVAAASGAIAGSNFWNPIGWAAALVAVGTGAVAVGARLESMGDACGTLNVVLEDQKEQLEANIHSQRTQYTSLQGELENYALEHDKLSGMSEETRGQLFSLTEQLKTGTIDQQTYNLAVKQLANEDQSSGALDILASTITGDGGTTANLGWLNQSLDTLAVGDDSKMMALTVAMSSLTTATERQRDAALDFAEKILNKQRNEEANKSGDELALHMSQAFQTAINNQDWASAEAIIQDLEKMGVDSKHIEWRMNHGKYAKGSGNEYEGIDSDEIYDLVKGGFWSGVETTQERISSGYLNAHNEVASKYGVSTVTSDEELANNAQVIAGVQSYFDTVGYNQLKSYRSADNNTKLYEQIKLANDMGILKKLKLKSKGNLDDSELQLISSATGIPTGSFAKGSASLPSDMIAQVHQGERIIPAESNDELGANIATQVELETLTNDLLTTSNMSAVKSNDLFLIQNELSTIGNDSLSTISDERLTKLDSDTLTFNSTMSTALTSQLVESQLERTILDTDLKDILSELKNLNKGFEPFWGMVDDAVAGNPANGDAFGTGEGTGDLGAMSSIEDPFGSKYPVTSPFGYRIHPISGTRKFHNGTDYGMPMGTPLYSFDNGKVTRNSYQAGGAGNFVEIENSTGYKYIFMHMQERSPLGVGQSVSVGQKIGNVGSTGSSTGPHLHLTVKDPSGNAIDPQQYFKDGYSIGQSYELNDLQQLLATIGIIESYGMSIDGDHSVSGPLGAIDYSWLKRKELGDFGLTLDAYGHYNKVGSGEWAYGPYQYTAKGSMDNTAQFISWLKTHGYSDIASSLGNGSVSGHGGALGTLWKATYDKFGRKFKEAQDLYQYDAYTTSMLTSHPFLSNYGAKALGVFAGWVNWMGAGGLSSVIRRAGGSSATLQQLFDARASYIRSLSNYGSFRDGWENRMRDEAAYVGVAAHKTGLSRVPYDEYPALLHKDERVLNAEEARMWNDYRANEHAVANYDPEIQEVYVSVDTDGVIDAVEALTAIVDNIYKLLKPKSTAQQTVTPRRSSNSIADYV